jgi:flagellar motility protein MotE (MotC chaperone)
MNLIRELRLIPIVLFATVCLLALKVLGFIMEDRAPLTEIEFRSSTFDKSPSGMAREFAGQPASQGVPPAKKPWAKEMFNFPDVTGSLANDKPAEKSAEKNGEKAGDTEKGGDKNGAKPGKPGSAEPPPPAGKVVPLHPVAPIPPGERALLERLQERREELDTRSRELEIRENLLKAAEQQLEIRMGELKELETRMLNASQQKDEAETLRFKSLVTMYENMKAKDAARIFDRLDPRVLLDVASQIPPRRMSDILAQMQPEAAQRLTVELANRANANNRPLVPKELPKIEGKPKAP